MQFEYIVGGMPAAANAAEASHVIAAEQSQLNKLGWDGWELVAAVSRRVGADAYTFTYYKRGLKTNDTDHQMRTEDQLQPETQVEHSGASDCSASGRTLGACVEYESTLGRRATVESGGDDISGDYAWGCVRYAVLNGMTVELKHEGGSFLSTVRNPMTGDHQTTRHETSIRVPTASAKFILTDQSSSEQVFVAGL